MAAYSVAASLLGVADAAAAVVAVAVAAVVDAIDAAVVAPAVDAVADPVDAESNTCCCCSIILLICGTQIREFLNQNSNGKIDFVCYDVGVQGFGGFCF